MYYGYKKFVCNYVSIRPRKLIYLVNTQINLVIKYFSFKYIYIYIYIYKWYKMIELMLPKALMPIRERHLKNALFITIGIL